MRQVFYFSVDGDQKSMTLNGDAVGNVTNKCSRYLKRLDNFLKRVGFVVFGKWFSNKRTIGIFGDYLWFHC